VVARVKVAVESDSTREIQLESFNRRVISQAWLHNAVSKRFPVALFCLRAHALAVDAKLTLHLSPGIQRLVNLGLTLVCHGVADSTTGRLDDCPPNVSVAPVESDMYKWNGVSQCS
jgi:hypothetical protein